MSPLSACEHGVVVGEYCAPRILMLFAINLADTRDNPVAWSRSNQFLEGLPAASTSHCMRVIFDFYACAVVRSE